MVDWNLFKPGWRNLPEVSAVLAGVMTAMVLVGWHVHSVLLVQVFPGLAPMQFNTALGLLGGAVALGLHGRGWRIPALIAAAVPLLLGATALIETYSNWNLGVDTLFVRPFTMTRTEFPGRMSVNSGVAHVLLGATMLLLAARQRWNGGYTALLLLSLTVLSIGLSALAGYLASLQVAYGWTSHSQMALHTAAGFALLGLGAFVAVWRESGSGYAASPVWVSAPVLCLVALTAVVLWQVLREHENTQVQRVTRTQAESIANSIRYELNNSVTALERLANVTQNRGIADRRLWEEDAEAFLGYRPGVIALEFINRQGFVSWYVPHLGNEILEGLVAAHDPERTAAMALARQQNLTVATPKVPLVQGGKGFLIYVPMKIDLDYAGMIAGVFDYRRLLGSILDSAALEGYEVELVDTNRSVLSSNSQDMQSPTPWTATFAVPALTRVWQVHVWPTRVHRAELLSPLPELVLGLGLMLALLLGLAVRWGRQARTQERALWSAYDKLTEETTAGLVAAEELRRSNTALSAVNQELESFSYAVSHDLRQPLRAMSGFAQILLEDSTEHMDAAGQGYLKRIQAASRRMSEQIDGLLRLSRITRGPLERVPVDLAELARQIAAELEEGDPERQVTWEIAGDLTCEGDPSLLRALLQNLMANAWKFTAHTANARITVGSDGANGTTSFYVRDNGAGFDMAYADKLFGAFQRLHAADTFPGTGIGLATVQRIVNRHGGRVWGEGEEDQGATFHFTL